MSLSISAQASLAGGSGQLELVLEKLGLELHDEFLVVYGRHH